jgi:carboxyl-terminal processing protease
MYDLRVRPVNDIAANSPGVAGLRGRSALATVLVLLFLLGGAGAAKAADLAYDRDQRMFADGYGYIDQHYIRKLDLRQIVVDGLAALGKIDQALSVRLEAGRLVLLYGGQPADAFAFTGQFGPADWATLTAKALLTARRVSPAVRAADSELVYATMFNGLLASLDPPFSRYAGRDQAAQNRATRQGFGGIGVHIVIEDGAARIASVIPGTPAERMDLHAGDVIAAIDGTSRRWSACCAAPTAAAWR